MVLLTVKTSDCTPQTIVIGRRTTYDTLQVVFDLNYLAETYGSGTAVLVVKRSQDETAYPATITQDGNTLTWTITEVDTYYVGAGECELMWYVNNGLAKTIIYPVVVMRDILQTAEEPPDGYENWIEHLTDLGAETLQNAQNASQSASEAEQAKDDAVDAKEASEEAARKAEAASVHAPVIVNGYWYAWDTEAEEYQNTWVKAEGRDGTDGFSPTITVADITGGHRVTITDVNGTRTVDVMDGTDGDDGYSPAVTITDITGGHRVTITDKTHPSGQTFDVMDGVIQSVNGKSAASITLDSGDIEFDDSETYAAGSIGAEVSDAKNAIGQLDDVVNDPVHGLAQKAPLIVNNASGDIASFPDGADSMPIKSLAASIEPVQDLHGYDNPWPAGGGKNLCDGVGYDGFISSNIPRISSKTPVTSPHNISTGYGGVCFVAPVKNGSTYALSSDATGSADFYWGIYSSIDDAMSTANVLQFGRANPQFTAEHDGYVVFLKINSSAGTSVTWTYVQAELGSSVTSYSPYANECPITGHTGLTVARTGANLLKPTGYGGTFYGAPVGTDLAVERAIDATPINDGYAVVIPSAWTGKIFATDVLPSGTYNFHVRLDSNNARISCSVTDADYVVTQVVGYNTDHQVTITGKGRIAIFVTSTQAETINVHDFQVEVGSTFTNYSPYTGTTIPITFPTTIYGGSDEVIGGALESTMGMVDLGTLNWQYRGNEVANTFSVTPFPYYKLVYEAKAICSNYAYNGTVSGIGQMYSAPDKCFCLYYQNGSTGTGLYIKDSAYTDVATFKAAMSGVQLCYELAEPVEYTLTANELTTLYGQNNVWTDVGEVSVDYPADTKLYIDNKIATAVANALNA